MHASFKFAAMLILVASAVARAFPSPISILENFSVDRDDSKFAARGDINIGGWSLGGSDVNE